MKTEETITITKKEHDRLKERDVWLGCLEAAGVDNWSGYGYACELKGDKEDEE